MGTTYQESTALSAQLSAGSLCLVLTAASPGRGARLTPAGPNPCERREKQGPALLGQAVKLLRKWLLVLALLTEGFYEAAQL